MRKYHSGSLMVLTDCLDRRAVNYRLARSGQATTRRRMRYEVCFLPLGSLRPVDKTPMIPGSSGPTLEDRTLCGTSQQHQLRSTFIMPHISAINRSVERSFRRPKGGHTSMHRTKGVRDSRRGLEHRTTQFTESLPPYTIGCPASVAHRTRVAGIAACCRGIAKSP